MKAVNLNRRGFTLTELLVCLLIITVVILPVVTLLAHNKRQQIAVERRLLAKHLAQAKLEEIKAMYWRDFNAGYLNNPVISPQPLTFGPPYIDGKYLTENDDRPHNDFTYRLQVWPDRSSLWATVQVTIYYQEAGQEKCLSLYMAKARR
ncbi:type IV pilus modification PilV family protein [Desulforamulus hydrothermalis]|uniref:Prepilin-type N-terminal cleavage/methylation domain-containing protein n=1 Tax=Desulforamulus hydrothermalis Lam5 = DSM 18033 TaxID=1121428 RepID=K8EK11_9FIRM|nr:prepilin-type N-terminal cleavage/methylation domain-containing protein [Desulforamulus hydrothermalis]CCO08871.1 conserved exported hypothetical protein [Desulforamulus hydrothermalis Lam5 = DSM 18033]SHG73674.1 prepilin-type N-terminal cleavage/methylation domain-containing protein [Desulforamulus hydrothermalis Lam5 = DSM 18033]